MSKNAVEPERPQMTIWRRVACRIYAQAHSSVRAPMRAHALTHACEHTNTQYSLLLHDNIGFMNVPQCFVIRTLAVLLLCFLKCTFIHASGKIAAFPPSVFTKRTNNQHGYMQFSFAKFHPYRTIDLEGKIWLPQRRFSRNSP